MKSILFDIIKNIIANLKINSLKNFWKIAIVGFITLFFAFILALSIRGIPGNPDQYTIAQDKWKDNGPLELSPDRGRFALMYSIVENKSFHFTLPLAEFTLPDLGYEHGYYVSLFAPAVSFIIIPGYLLGKAYGISQVGSFAIIALFALINALLIRSIAILLKANSIAATIAAIAFLFASPSFAYAVTLYQHHISVFLILASIYTLLRWKNIWSLSLIWFFCAASIPVDYPNLFFMLPIGLFATGRFFSIENYSKKFVIKFKMIGVVTFLSVLIPLGFFLIVNKLSYGNPLQLAGNVATVKSITNGVPVLSYDARLSSKSNNSQQKDVAGYFRTRNLLNGFFIHFTSPDRGIIWFTPVMLIGIVGIYFLFKKNPYFVGLLLAILGMNVILYSLWDDPWGGWGFGSRYLIPSYAIMSIFIAIALSKFRKNILFLCIFYCVFLYSLSINTLGALTSNRMPPKGEADALSKISGRIEKYTYERDVDFLKGNQSKSFVWQTYLKNHITAVEYYWVIVGLISLFAVSSLVLLETKKERSRYDNV